MTGVVGISEIKCGGTSLRMVRPNIKEETEMKKIYRMMRGQKVP